METNSTYAGQLDMLLLRESSIINVNGRESLVVPLDANPALFDFTAGSGRRKLLLDFIIRRSVQPRFGSTHFVKTSVGRANRERFGMSQDQARDCSTIIGNIRPIEQKRQASPANGQDMEDMPEEIFNGF